MADHRTTLVRILTSVAEHLRPTHDRGQHEGFGMWNYASLHEATPVELALRSHPEIIALSGLWLDTLTSRSPLRIDFLARTLVERAMETPADEVIDSLLRIIRGEEAPLVVVQGVRGLSVEDEVRLTADVTLSPPSALRRVHAWTRLFESTEPSLMPGAPPGVPTAALVHRGVTKARFVPQDAPRRQPDELRKAHMAFHAARPALLLGGVGAPTFDGLYHYVDAPGWPHLNGTGVSRSGPSVRVRPDKDKPPAQDFKGAADLLSRHRLDATLSRAVRKLEESRGRTQDADRALDLGTCLELLLMRGDGNSGDISLKTRLRAAWLVGETAVDRREIHDLVKKAYDLRSRSAHEGWIPAKSAEQYEQNLRWLDRTDALCARLIRHLLEHGWPDWLDLVLGADAGAADRDA